MLDEISLENSQDDSQKNEKFVESKVIDNDNNLPTNTKHRNISIIVQELQRELAKPFMEVNKILINIKLNILNIFIYLELETLA